MKKTSLFKAAVAALAMASSVVAVSAVISTPAAADVAASKALVDAAKAKGTVGERNNGYLGFVSGSGDAATKAAVDEINAGRGSVRKWIERYGDPRDPKVDAVDWVEQIPFSETRNYVQRIMENLQVYRARFGGGTRLQIEADLRRGASVE